MAWQPLGRNGRSLTADGSAVTTDADGLADKPKLHKRPVIDPPPDASAEIAGLDAHRALVSIAVISGHPVGTGDCCSSIISTLSAFACAEW